MWIQRFLAGLLLAMMASSVLAFDRPFPPIAKRGKMEMGAHPEIVINGKTRRLSAGGRIFNQQNLIQMPSSVIASDIVINYTEDFQGYIDRVWILTEKEAAQTPAAQKINQPR